MSSLAAGELGMARERGTALLGRPFVGLGFDYLVIGGGLSLIWTLYLALFGLGPATSLLEAQLPALILLSTSAHFAASTVRLYSTQGSFERFPVLTMVLPLVAVVALGLGVLAPGRVGHHLQKLYLTWSPYHYAAQAYGLALMYGYRSGAALVRWERLALRLACLLPFLLAFVTSPEAGLAWLVPRSWLQLPPVAALRAGLAAELKPLVFVLPLGLFLWLARGPRPRMPLLSLLVVIANGVWWVALVYLQAFFWATVFHALQYLAIAVIFHTNERLAVAGNTARWWSHALRFYAASLALGFLLFQVWPWGYVLLGFTLAESVLVAAAVINVHHFIVDGYIWRLRRDPNLAIVTAAAPAAQ